jgi:hypothetical protein
MWLKEVFYLSIPVPDNGDMCGHAGFTLQLGEWRRAIP